MEQHGFKSVLSDKGYDRVLKVLLVGNVAVGKTNTILRYMRGVFESNTLSTMGVDFEMKNVVVSGQRIRVQVWDTAGQEKYHTLTRSYYNQADAIILIYSVTDRQSFESVDKWLDDIKNNCKANTQVVLVSNKNDYSREDRQVDWDEGQQLAIRMNLKYFAASAKTGQNIDQIFYYLCQKTIQNQGGLQTLVTSSRLVPREIKKQKGCAC